jgi:single-strand DNA-binding protein
MDSTVIVIGNLTADPDLAYTPNGTALCRLGVAVTRREHDGDVWRDGETSFYDVVCWRHLAENVAESLHKGDRVVVVGRLRQRSWESPEGERRSKIEVNAEELSPSLRWARGTIERTGSSSSAKPEEQGVLE